MEGFGQLSLARVCLGVSQKLADVRFVKDCFVNRTKSQLALLVPELLVEGDIASQGLQNTQLLILKDVLNGPLED